MGAGNSLRMKPPVISGCKFKSKLFVLVIIFADVNIVAVGGAVVEGLAFYFCLLVRPLPLDIAKFCEFLLDLHQIVLRERDVEGSGNAFQMRDLCLCLKDQIGKRLVGAL